MAAQQGSWSQADKDAWQRQRLADELARGIHSATGPVARFLTNKPRVKSQSKDAFADLTDKLNKQLKKSVNDAIKEKTAPTFDEVQQAAKAGAVLHFNGDSTCFASLSWQSDDGGDGTVTATFQNGYGPYTAPLDLETFLDWTDDSAGKFFNEVMGQDFFTATKGKGD